MNIKIAKVCKMNPKRNFPQLCGGGEGPPVSGGFKFSEAIDAVGSSEASLTSASIRSFARTTFD